jgi:uncharacterized protein YodC (DUF2158 family)
LKERTATDVYDPVAWIGRKLRPRQDALAEAEPGGGLDVVRAPQRFAVKDVIRLKSGGRPMARVGAVLLDGKLEIWVLKMKGTQQHWKGPKTIDAGDVINNYGPLDEVGIGSKLVEQYITEDHAH